MAEEDAISWDEAYSGVDDYDTRKKEIIPDETELDYLSFYVDLPILLMYFLSHTSLSETEKDHKNLSYLSLVIRFLSTRHYRLHTYSQYDSMRMACFHPIVLDTFHYPVRKDEFYLIRMHPDLYAKLASLVGPKRENIYYDVYCTFANKKR